MNVAQGIAVVLLSGMLSAVAHAQAPALAGHVDNSTTPVTFRIGSNHGASLIKLEPLD